MSYLRDANAKLIERLYLIEVNKQKDSIINLNKLYIVEQNNIIKDFQGKVVNLTNTNNDLNKSITKQKNTNKFLLGLSTASIIGVIVSILIK